MEAEFVKNITILAFRGPSEADLVATLNASKAAVSSSWCAASDISGESTKSQFEVRLSPIEKAPT